MFRKILSLLLNCKKDLLPGQPLEQLRVQHLISLYEHQNTLMWSRLQTVGVIQGGVLAAAYKAQLDHCSVLAAFILLLGAVLTILIWITMERDEVYRDAARSKIQERYHTKDILPDPESNDFPRGKHIKIWIMLLLLFADIAMYLRCPATLCQILHRMLEVCVHTAR